MSEEPHDEIARLRRERDEALVRERLLRSVLDALPEGVAVKDLAGRVVYVNPATARRFGAGPEALTGAPAFAPMDTATAALLRRLDESALALRTPVESLVDCRHVDGPLQGLRVDHVWKTVVDPGDAGGPYILTRSRDVTDQQRSADELAYQRVTLQAVMDADPNLIVVKDEANRYVLVNRACCLTLGRSETDLLGRSPEELFGSDAQAWNAADAQVRASGREWIDENVTVPGTAGRRVLRVVRRLIVGPDGARYVLVVGSDVSEITRQRERIARSHALLRAVIDADDSPIFMKARDGRHLLVNAAYLRLWDLTEGEVVGHHSLEFFPDAPGLHRSLELDADTWREGSSDAVQTVDVRGGERVFALKRSIVVGPGGEPMMLGIARDITDERLREEVLGRALRQAEEANEAKSRFLANMSHEIRTPIHGVIGLTELALGAELAPQVRDWLEAARRSADLLLAVVDDVLDLSKIEAGAMTVETCALDLHDLLAEVALPQAVRAFGKGLDFALVIEPDVPEHTTGDPTRLRQVVLNLLSNAVKFTARGSVRLRVDTVAGAGGEPRVRFAVEDDGPGVPPDQRARIFEAFTQADESTTRRFGGTGLGLPISARLVALMGGRLELDDAGPGSRFVFDLPMAPAGGTDWDGLAGCRLGLLCPPGMEVPADLLRWLVAWGLQVADAPPGDSGHPPDLLLTCSHWRPDGAADLDRWLDGARSAGRPVFAVVRQPPFGHPALEALEALRGAGVPGVALVTPHTPRALFDALRRSQAARSAAPAGMATHLAGMRVLLVEDNEVNRMLAIAQLGMLGATVQVAADGAEALAALGQATRFDLVLTDIQMPRLDGMELVRRCREAERSGARARVPVLAMTAHALVGDRERFLAAGFDGYIAKPVLIDRMLEEFVRIGLVPGG
jgi:two-component system sensor histidine kinase/response regulator